MSYTIHIPAPEAAFDVLVDHSLVWSDGAQTLREDAEAAPGAIAWYVTSAALDFAHWAANDALENNDEPARDDYSFLADYITVVHAGVLRNDAYTGALEELLLGHLRFLDDNPEMK